MEDTRIAVVAIIVENADRVDKVNALLHEYGQFIVGRMGLPHREKNVNVISVVLDAPAGVINGLTGKLGMLDGVGAKALYSNK